jgi:hypothetical protein
LSIHPDRIGTDQRKTFHQQEVISASGGTGVFLSDTAIADVIFQKDSYIRSPPEICHVAECLKRGGYW